MLAPAAGASSGDHQYVQHVTIAPKVPPRTRQNLLHTGNEIAVVDASSTGMGTTGSKGLSGWHHLKDRVLSSHPKDRFVCV